MDITGLDSLRLTRQFLYIYIHTPNKGKQQAGQTAVQRLPCNFIFAQRLFALYEIALQESLFFSKTTEPELFFPSIVSCRRSFLITS